MHKMRMSEASTSTYQPGSGSPVCQALEKERNRSTVTHPPQAHSLLKTTNCFTIYNKTL